MGVDGSRVHRPLREPRDPDFGAQTFGTDIGAGGTPVTDHSATANGGGYLDLGTESLRNIAYVTTGHAGSRSRFSCRSFEIFLWHSTPPSCRKPSVPHRPRAKSGAQATAEHGMTVQTFGTVTRSIGQPQAGRHLLVREGTR